jgi:hypothetical protein
MFEYEKDEALRADPQAEMLPVSVELPEGA